MNYAIGLDIGIESVGFSILELDSEDSPCRIIKLGTRIFDRTEHPKNGESLAAPRREARSMRRRLRRHRHRIERIRSLICSCGILNNSELQDLYNGRLPSVYELRARALDEVLSAREFARILIHIAQRRGFKSNRKKLEESDKENGKLLSAVNENKALMEKKHYRTVGEMLYLDEKFADYKRNKSESYSNTIDRALIEDEVRKIFRAQRNLGAAFALADTEEKYLEILMSQRSFSEGPGAGPYSGNQADRMIGRCTFEKEEFRAAKATYSFQIFNLWQHINHIKVASKSGTRSLTDEERNRIFNAAHMHKELSYSQIRKLIDLPEDITFIGIKYTDTDIKKCESKKIKDLTFYHDIKKCLDANLFKKLTPKKLDAIGEAFAKSLSDEEIENKLQEADICEATQKQLLGIPNYPKYGHLSLAALKRIIPFLEKGMTYDKACEAAGYKFKADDKDAKRYLPPLSQDDRTITSPVVRRAVSQTVKIINAVIREMNESPVYINIELARELSKDCLERRKIEKQYNENAAENEKIKKQLCEYIPYPCGQDIIKFKLWKEQNGICPYCLEHISIERLFETGYVDIDHIVPYSKCFDDRMKNKVLTFARENRQKGNRLPLEYLTGQRRDQFIVWVKNHNYSQAKKALLLKESVECEKEWKLRNLQDTQFISSFLYSYISNNLKFASSKSGKIRRVFAVNGAITSYVRKRWGIKKVREDGDLHHAVDATVVGCISQKMINTISKYSFYKETLHSRDYVIDPETGEVFERFPKPWPHFLDELTIRLTQDEEGMRMQLNALNYPSYCEVDIDEIKAPFVSRMCNRKVTGAAHKQTVKSSRLIENGLTITKTDIKKLKLNDKGEIENYYNPESDRLLYDALVKRLREHNNNGEKAFEAPFYKPKADGSNGPLVKKVKLTEKTSSVVKVHNNTAIAENDAMVRCDVFYVDNEGYYFVPIYVADTVKDKLPSLAPT